MELFNNPLFLILFDTAIPRVILKADHPDFTIVNYNTSYQDATGMHGNELRGKSLWAVYDPEKSGGEGGRILREALTKAAVEGKPVHMPPFKYDIPSNDGQESISSWWQLEIIPVAGADQRPEYLLTTTNNITATVQNERLIKEGHAREQVLKDELNVSHEEVAAINEELSASNEELTATIEELSQAQESLQLLNQDLERRIDERVKELAESESSLRNLVMTAHYPLMILRGREWIIEIANPPLVNLWDKTIEGVTGHPLMEILPEIEGQPFPGFLRQVYDTGVGYGEEEQIFHYDSPAGPAVKWVNYYYDPLRNDAGEVCGIIVAADDVTDRVKAKLDLQDSYQQQQALNEEFSAVNEELASIVEELSASNEELVVSQQNLEVKNTELGESESRFRNLIRQAPVGICVIRAEDLMVQEVNDDYLVLVGKKREELENQTIWEAVSEAAASYAPVMQEVITSGKAFVADEHELQLLRNGELATVFIDFVYEPVINSAGVVTTIMVVAIDVTEKVLARKDIEYTEERIRLAVEAAEIGTFDHELTNNALVTSDRFNAIFGLEETASRDEFLKVYHPDDLHLSIEANKTALQTGTMNYEARLIHANQSLHWIRVQGKVYFDRHQQPVRILGTLLDITEFKHLQQQKDDFISIASHELKTPITTLKASLQLLDKMKENPSATMLPKLIEQSNRSMGKISSLVEDLLNVSRMNEGQVKLNKKTFTIAEMLTECCHHVRAGGNYDLILEGDRGLQVFADEHRIDQVVVNLVNNAVKYASASREIHLRVEREGNMAKVIVQDFGPGIEPEKIPNLFDRYFRANEAANQISGLGLGLYISADIIHRHGGQIGVVSEPGKGSSFWFTLPLDVN